MCWGVCFPQLLVNAEIKLLGENLNIIRKITETLLGAGKEVGRLVIEERIAYVHILSPDCVEN